MEKRGEVIVERWVIIEKGSARLRGNDLVDLDILGGCIAQAKVGISNQTLVPALSSLSIPIFPS